MASVTRAAAAAVHDFDIPDHILKSSAMTRAVTEAAEKIADNVKDQGVMVEGEPGDIDLPVTVSVYDTDRARATVWLSHPSGAAVQAKNGTLTRAASAAGAKVQGG